MQLFKSVILLCPRKAYGTLENQAFKVLQRGRKVGRESELEGSGSWKGVGEVGLLWCAPLYL